MRFAVNKFSNLFALSIILIMSLLINACSGGTTESANNKPLDAITTYSINNVNGIISAGSGGKYNITLTLPFGTNLESLVATFTATGTNIKIGSTTQISGVTSNNFSSPPVVYTITAANGSVATYNVIVGVALSSDNIVLPHTQPILYQMESPMAL